MKDRNAYNLGIGPNLKEIFGTDRKKWAFVFHSSLGDGITFHRRKNEPHTDLEQGYISVPT
jgi:hypothetical protein